MNYVDCTNLTKGRIKGVELRLYPAIRRTILVDYYTRKYHYMLFPPMLFAKVEASSPVNNSFGTKPYSGHLLCGAFCKADAELPSYHSTIYTIPFASIYGYALCLGKNPHFLFRHETFNTLVTKFWQTSFSEVRFESHENVAQIFSSLKNQSHTLGHLFAAIHDYRQDDFYLR
jgi:hypothetical protein